MRIRIAAAVLWCGIVASMLLTGCSGPSDPGVSLDARSQVLAKGGNQDAPGLIDLPGVVGEGEGVDEAGNPAFIILTERAGVAGIPAYVKGKPVVILGSGKIKALDRIGSAGKPTGKPSEPAVDPKARFPRPVPIGVSVGNEGECSAGTFGARVKDAIGNVYMLSNNHVFAREIRGTVAN